MMVQDRAESTWLTISYGSFISQFTPNTIKSIRQLETKYIRICRQNRSILFNEICANEEMLPKYKHTYKFLSKFHPTFLLCYMMTASKTKSRISRCLPENLNVSGVTVEVGLF